MSNKNCVCFVDDDEIYRYIIEQMVATIDSTLQVLFFTDAELAFKYLQRNSDNAEVLPETIFLDINMPFMDGWSFLEQFATIKNQLQKTINIYLVSSSIDEADIKRAKANSEVCEYIVKPISSDKLIKILNNPG